MPEDESENEESMQSAQSLRMKLAQFAHSAPSPLATPTKRVANAHDPPALLSEVSKIPGLESPSTAATHLKRSLPSEATSSPSPRKKAKRGYASPDTYAHLKPVSDYLRVGLDGEQSLH